MQEMSTFTGMGFAIYDIFGDVVELLQHMKE